MQASGRVPLLLGTFSVKGKQSRYIFKKSFGIKASRTGFVKKFRRRRSKTKRMNTKKTLQCVEAKRTMWIVNLKKETFNFFWGGGVGEGGRGY